jgi:hypothetical protein
MEEVAGSDRGKKDAYLEHQQGAGQRAGANRQPTLEPGWLLYHAKIRHRLARA